MLKAGVGMLSEDRKTEGLAIRLPVDDNVLSAIIDRLSRVAGGKGDQFAAGDCVLFRHGGQRTR